MSAAMRLSLGPCGRALLMRGVQTPVVAARALQTSTGRRETYSKLQKFVLLAKDSLYICIIKESFILNQKQIPCVPMC